MQTYDWIQTATEVYGQDGQNETVIVGDISAPRAIAVFCRNGVMRGLRLAGAMDIGESVEALYADDTAKDDLARGIVRLGFAVDLGHYPTSGDFSQRLSKAGKGRGLTLVRKLPQQAMPSLSLDEKWKTPLDQCSRSRRQQYRRKWRKAEAIGPVALEILTPSETEMEPIFDRIVAVEAKSWKGRAGTALLHDEKQAAFFRSFGRKMAAKGRLRLCFLTIGGQDAAMTFATVWDNRFWAIKVGYDENFAPISPGEALLVELIRYSAENDYSSFEFCGKDAPWTRAWAEDATEIEALRFYPLTVFGLGRLALDSWQMARQRFAARIAKNRD
ncbi:GNAT family N-acetyltransferase [Marimonas lutisalis]|uniref:GNAT family N-acetyltransferase n=1 Tax=Marimonas lutisalis TaxID=2545756 RepID=UPI0010F7BAE0|nr:GNAT family N-acetyltransferase [Marimonas lutisalis]